MSTSGGRMRFGPAKVAGLALSDQIGLVNIHPIHLHKDGRVIDLSGANAVLHAIWNR